MDNGGVVISYLLTYLLTFQTQPWAGNLKDQVTYLLTDCAS